MITYIDTSVLLKLLIEDEHGSEAAERVWLASDHVVCAEIGYVEARAALAAASRAGRLDGDALESVKIELERLWAQVDRVTMTAELLIAAGRIAERESLRGYDAVHLTAALEAGTTAMATADKQLLDAASRSGLDTIDPNTRPRILEA